MTINSICAASGVSKNTFYYYYHGKQELLFSMLEAASENYAQIMYAIAIISSSYEKLKAIASGVLDYILYLGPAVIRKSLELQFAGTKEMTGHEQPSDFGKLVCSFFLKAQAAGEIRKMFRRWI